MKKLESLKSSVFDNFKLNELSNRNKLAIFGGAVATCINNCVDSRTGTVNDPDEIVSIDDKDCKLTYGG